MARRRSKPQSSSLDLFLDTICNAFGGIMFLSILISVLLQFRGTHSAGEVDQPTISQAESQFIEEQIAKLQSERTQLAATITALERSMVGEDQTEVLELQTQLAQGEKKREQTVERQFAMSKHLSDVETEVRERQHELKELDQNLTVAKASLVDKTNAVDVALNSLEQKSELPKVRTTSKSNIIFMMRYGKLYLVTDVTNPSHAGYYSAHVTEKTSFGVTRIKPRLNAGWDLSRPTDVAEFERLVAGSPSSSTFFSCAVWPDSFEQFAAVKQTLLRLGYDYHLLPVDDVDDLPIGRGGSATVQ